MHFLLFHQLYRIQNYFICSWPNDWVLGSSLVLHELKLYSCNSSYVVVSTFITKIFIYLITVPETSEQQLPKRKTLWISSSYRLELWTWALIFHTQLNQSKMPDREAYICHVELFSYVITRNKTFPCSNCLITWKRYMWTFRRYRSFSVCVSQTSLL